MLEEDIKLSGITASEFITSKVKKKKVIMHDCQMVNQTDFPRETSTASDK